MSKPEGPHEWAERGNALLAGTMPTLKGEYLKPRRDVHWVVRNGRPVIEWKQPLGQGALL